MLKRGFLMAFEGIDGAGKTTQARRLRDYVEGRGMAVVLSKEPTDGVYGQKIRKLAQTDRHRVKPREEYELFINDRREHVSDLLRPSLDAKKIVILDRYYFSTIAYQGAIGLDPGQIQSENEQFSPIPDIVFLLQVPPRVGIRRIQTGRNEIPNLFEQEDYLARVKTFFDAMTDPYIKRINGEKAPDAIHNEIKDVVDDVMEHYTRHREPYRLPASFQGRSPVT